MHGVRKEHLPTKLCTVCLRPFTWRKKWEKVWAEVKYCSDACRRNKDAARTLDSAGQSKTAAKA